MGTVIVNGIRRKLDWRPSLPDAHETVYEHSLRSTMQVTALPESVDLRPRCSPVLDQGDLGSCSAHALVGALEFGPKPETLSRLYVYWNERYLEGTTATDAGASTLADGCKAIQKWGAAPESLWPYDDSLLTKRPPDSVYYKGLPNKIKSYVCITSQLGMRHCLASGLPFVLGFTVYASFMRDDWWSSGLMPVPVQGEQVEGGHAVLAVGYDTEGLWIKNSWGISFGINGYFRMPWSLVLSITEDHYVVNV